MTLTQILLLRQFFGAVLLFAVVLVIFIMLVGRQMYDRAAAEVSYRHQYGAEWKEHYSADRHVSVEDDHRKLVVGMGALVLVPSLCYLIYRQVAPKRRARKRSSRRRQSFSLPT
ncbi:MAG: hypothetical protein ABJF10_04985 [Chthoniobacter sp.]|uniref:hypothetical protein n=1 Tax=Chthoniobacter sp. TaxID=2510640 RepID=UPI0032A802F7